ncbi:MAG TPA: hypothetical protein VHV08_11125 [Pirellulales bacterium]|jgi:hypothetical protein|nr:hypothetical protein [Pirellulales bacterium]
MSELLAKLDNDSILALGGMLVGMVAILGGMTVAITKLMASYYRKTQLDEMEATLKMEMIERGMSADDIARILQARMGPSKPSLGDLLGPWRNLGRSAKFGKPCGKG